MLVVNTQLYEGYYMKCYDDFEEAIELFNRAIEASFPIDGFMEVYEEYCEMIQREKTAEYSCNG